MHFKYFKHFNGSSEFISSILLFFKSKYSSFLQIFKGVNPNLPFPFRQFPDKTSFLSNKKKNASIL